MVRRHDDLFGQIANFGALIEATRRAVRGKRAKRGAAAFLARLEPECFRLERELLSGHYRPGAYREFLVRDPKCRLVSAAPFRDRVVHHALHAVIGPIFERGFIFDSYANRVGKGTHRAVARYEHFRDRNLHVLRADIWRYFPSIDHQIMLASIARRIACPRTLALCERIVAARSPAHALADAEVAVYFPGDDLFSPSQRPRGLPLGNLTSQFFANVYLDALDHWATEVLRLPYLRYVDDFALFARSQAPLREARERLATWLQGRRLLLHPDKTGLQPCAEPATFLGYELHPGGRRRLPAANVARFRARLDRLRQQWRCGVVDDASVRSRIQAWVAYASHADTAGLRHALLKDGWFDPYWGDGRAVCC